MIELNREEFEELSGIVERIENLDFNEHTKEYESSLMCCSSEAYVNGAWYAFQEQQKKLDCCREENKALLDKLNVPDGYKIVPVEPSEDLVNHGHQVFLGHFNEGGQTGGRSLYFAYKAMIGAAP